jgi:O-antigen/teichoic acid export membrane protein
VIIAQTLSSDAVVPYNIALKYYGVALAAFTVFLTPFWSAYTEAFTRGDTPWISMTIRKLKNAWIMLAGVLVVMTVVADRVYSFWVGHVITIPLSLSVLMAVYVLVIAWNSIFAYFINGTGKIRLQLWIATGAALAMVPIAILLVTYFNLGSQGVVLATSLCLLPGCFLWPLQVRKLVAGTARGIWSR